MNKITNLLCLNFLLLGATALGMDNPAKQLLDAVRRGNLGEVERLIREGVSIEAKDNDGWTSLFYASARGHEDVCWLLIVNKASVGAKSNGGSTPLMIAAEYGSKDVCKLLIDAQLESARKNKAAIATFLGIVRKRKQNLPCLTPNDVAKIIACQTFQLAMWPVIEQINQLEDQDKAHWLAYVKQQMNSANK